VTLAQLQEAMTLYVRTFYGERCESDGGPECSTCFAYDAVDDLFDGVLIEPQWEQDWQAAQVEAAQ